MIETLKARVFECLTKNCYWLAMLGDPAGDALPNAEFQSVQYFRMRVFRRPQDEVIFFEHVHEARVTFNNFYGKIQNAIQRLMKAVGGGDPAYGVVQDIYV